MTLERILCRKRFSKDCKRSHEEYWGKKRDYPLWRREVSASVTLGVLIVALGKALIKVHWTLGGVYTEGSKRKSMFKPEPEDLGCIYRAVSLGP